MPGKVTTVYVVDHEGEIELYDPSEHSMDKLMDYVQCITQKYGYREIPPSLDLHERYRADDINNGVSYVSLYVLPVQ